MEDLQIFNKETFVNTLFKKLISNKYFLYKIKSSHMFEKSLGKLDKVFKVLKGQGSISEINVAQTMKEIRKALLTADVDFKTAKSLLIRLRKSYGAESAFCY